MEFIALGMLCLITFILDYIQWKDELKDMREDENYDGDHKE